MSSVSPADGGYRFVQASLTELEDGLEAEAARKEQIRKDEVKQLERSYQKDLKKREDENQQTVDNTRGTFEQAAIRDKENHRYELEKIKQQLYDQRGLMGTQTMSETAALKDQLASSEMAASASREADKRMLDQQERAYQQRVSEQSTNAEAELEDQAKRTRDSANETYHSTIQDQKTQFHEYQKEAEQQTADLDKARMDEQNEQRRRYNEALTSVKRDAEHQLRLQGEAAAAGITKQATQAEKEIEDRIEASRKSHIVETRRLRDKIKMAADSPREVLKGKAEGRRDAIVTYQEEARINQELQQRTHEAELSKSRNDARKMEAYLTGLADDTVRSKDAYFSNLIKKQSEEHRDQASDLSEKLQSERAQNELTLKANEKASQQVIENQAMIAARQREEALQSQAKEYQKTIERSRLSSEDQIKALEKQLSLGQKSSDISSIPPAIEEKLRRQFVMQHEGAVKEREENTAQTLGEMHHRNVSRLQDLIDKQTGDENLMSARFASERTSEQSEFLSHLADQDFMAKNNMRNLAEDHERESDAMIKEQAKSLERQRRQYGEIIEVLKLDAESRLQEARQEASFREKMTQRKNAADQTNLVREMDKKFAIQKDEYEGVIQEIREQSDRQIRDADHRNALELDRMAKTYEQRLAQLEYQHAERERYLMKNSEEELDKIKRANAHNFEKS